MSTEGFFFLQQEAKIPCILFRIAFFIYLVATLPYTLILKISRKQYEHNIKNVNAPFLQVSDRIIK